MTCKNQLGKSSLSGIAVNGDSISTNVIATTTQASVVGPTYYASAPFAWDISTTNTKVSEVLDKMPLLLQISCIEEYSKNKLEIIFKKYSHKEIRKFLPKEGCLYFGNDLFGVYSGLDYLYWENTIIVEFEDINIAKDKLYTDQIFTTINNWDSNITNEEVTNFIKNPKFYKRYAHLTLEGELIKEKLEQAFKLTLHNNLDDYLL